MVKLLYALYATQITQNVYNVNKKDVLCEITFGRFSAFSVLPMARTSTQREWQDKSTAVGRGACGRFACIFGAALHLAWRRSSQKNQLNQRYLRRHLNRLDALAVKLRLSFAGLVVAIIGMRLDSLGGDKNSRK